MGRDDGITHQSSGRDQETRIEPLPRVRLVATRGSGEYLVEILAADILKESVPRSVLDNSIWAIIARFKSLQTRAQAEMATARARAASQVIVLQ